jgi:hypothetical protein
LNEKERKKKKKKGKRYAQTWIRTRNLFVTKQLSMSTWPGQLAYKYITRLRLNTDLQYKGQNKQ